MNKERKLKFPLIKEIQGAQTFANQALMPHPSSNAALSITLQSVVLVVFYLAVITEYLSRISAQLDGSEIRLCRPATRTLGRLPKQFFVCCRFQAITHTPLPTAA